MKTKFTELYNYRSSFKLITIGSLTLVVASLILVGVMYYIFTQNQNDSTQQIWVKTQDGSIFSVDKSEQIVLEDRIVEYKHHTKWFYNLWYTLNRANNEDNINTALNLVTTEQGEDLLDVYTSQGVFQKLTQTGRSFECKMEGEPEIKVTSQGIFGQLKGYLKFFDENGQIYRNQHLDVAFELKDVISVQGRTNKNPHGVLVSSWEIINDTEVKNIGN